MNRVLELTKAGNQGSRCTSAGVDKDPLSQSKTTSAALAHPPIPISTSLWNEAFVFVTETSASSLERRKISENRSTALIMLERSIFESSFKSSRSTGIFGLPQ